MVNNSAKSASTGSIELIVSLSSSRQSFRTCATRGIRLVCVVREVPTLEWLTPSNALHILRHTRATDSRDAMSAHDNSVQISIAGDGEGFDPGAAAGGLSVPACQAASAKKTLHLRPKPAFFTVTGDQQSRFNSGHS